MGLKVNSIQVDQNFDFGNVSIGGKDNTISDNSTYSTILAGQNNTIGTYSYNSVILGGSGLELDNENNVVLVPSLKIATASNVSADRILVWDTDNYVKYREVSTIGGGGGSVSINTDEVGFGTGTGLTSSTNFKFNSTCNNLIAASKGGEITNSENSTILGGECYSGTPTLGKSGGNQIIGGKNNLVTGGYFRTYYANTYNYPNRVYNSYSSTILGGRENILGTSSNSSIVGGACNIFSNSSNSSIISGLYNIFSNSNNSSIIGGRCNTLTKASNQSSIVGGYKNTLSCYSNQSSIVGGCCNKLSCFSYFSSIVGGRSNTLSCQSCNSSIVGGLFNTIATASSSSSIIGGQSNTLSGTSSYSSIVGGQFNTISCNSCNSVILGGVGLTLSNECSVVLVPSLKIATASNVSASASRVLVWDDNNYVGYLEVSTIGGGGSMSGTFSGTFSVSDGGISIVDNGQIKDIYYYGEIGYTGSPISESTINAGLSVTIRDYFDDTVNNKVTFKTDTPFTVVGNGFQSNTSITSLVLTGATGIDAYSFAYCTNLTSIDLPNVITIGANSFAGTSLTSIDLPEVITIVGISFQYCTLLDTINLPKVITIGDASFQGCILLETINLPQVQTIGGYSFQGCTSLTSINLPQAQKIGDAFSSNSFQGCTSLTTVDLPQVTTIGGYSFQGCTSLETINLPKVITIGDAFSGNSFDGCASLTTIDLPEVQTLGDDSFNGCTLLISVKIPKCITLGTTTGDDSVFNSCASGLEVITNIIHKTSNSGNPDDDLQYVINTLSGTVIYVNDYAYEFVTGTFSGTFSVDGRTSVVDNGQVKDIYYYGEIGYTGTTIDESTINAGLSGVTIRDYYDNGVDKVTFKTDLPFTVANNGFINNTSITSLVLHGATGIGDYSFYSCTNLTSIDLPEVQTTGDNSFAGCSSLTLIDLPQVQTIGVESFRNCTSITTIDLPQVITIGYYSFAGCSSLTTINLPQVQTIGEGSFNGCSSLTTIDLPKVITTGDSSFGGCTNLTTIDLPQVQTLGNNSFDSCSSLGTASLPQVQTLGYNSFTGCTSLDIIDLPQVQTIGANSFDGCTLLTTVNLPQVQTIGNSSFQSCTSLTTIDLPQAQILDAGIFLGCTNLTTIDLPQVKTLGTDSFNGCSSLGTASLPQVQTIGDNSFNGCTLLTSVKIPKCITLGSTTGDDSVFLNCAAGLEVITNIIHKTSNSGNPDGDLQYVIDTLSGTVIYVNELSYSGITGTFSIPDGRTVDVNNGVVMDTYYYGEIGYTGTAIDEPTINAGLSVVIRDYYDNGVDKVTFKTDTLFTVVNNGFQYNTSITSLVLHGATGIGDSSFYSCTNLTTIDLPQVITTGDNSFYGCSLILIDLPQAITIVANSFGYCTSLTTIDLPQVITIGDGSFYSCSLLTTINLPEVQTTGEYSFFNCTTLTTIDLPKVITIGPYSFYGCTSLTTIDLPKTQTLGANSFYGCTFLGTASLPQAQTIGDNSFDNCTLLVSVKIPKCTTLGIDPTDNGVFNSCASSLEVITNIFLKTSNSGNPDDDLQYVINTLSGTVIYVNDYAYEFVTGTFSGTFSVSDGRTSVVDNGEIKDIFYYGEIRYTGGTITETTINAGLSVVIRDYYDDTFNGKVTFKTDLPFTVINSGFESNTSITNLVLHGATGIGNNSFKDCTNLTTIDLPKVTSIGDQSFKNCPPLITVSLTQVTSIGDQSFISCTSLTTVYLPLVQTLGDYSFCNCPSLTTVYLPLVQTIGDNSFDSCTLLPTIDLPLVTSIGDYSFYNCTLLVSVKIPKCTTLGMDPTDNGVFNSCASSLEVITNIIHKTSNSGNPDGDLQYVIDTLSGTILYVNDYNYSISIPNNQVAFGSLTGLTSSSAFTFKSGPSESNLIIGGLMSGGWSVGASIISRNSNISSSYDSSIIGGNSNCLCSSPLSAIIGGIGGEINSSENSTILGGERYTGTPDYGQSGGNQIIGGKNNLVTGGFYCNNGTYTYNFPNRVYDSISSAILGGRGNILGTSSNSAIIGGFGLTLSNENNVVLVPTLKIATASNVSADRILVWDDNNYVSYREASTISGGLITTQTVLSYTMSLVDAGSTLIMDNSIAQNIIIDTYANVAFVAGTKIDVVQIGSGTVSFSAEPGVTLNSKNSYTRIANQYSAATLLNISSDNWVLIGNLTS